MTEEVKTEAKKEFQDYEVIRVFIRDKYDQLIDGAFYYIVLPFEEQRGKSYRRVRYKGQTYCMRLIQNQFGFKGKTLLDGLVLRTIDIKKTKCPKGEYWSYSVVADYRSISLINIDLPSILI